ncbi:T9SS type A sorting domain-containing protein [Winogradskyella echinorum]|uniref:T9SS type A sorting domain-containing protein n=1 Tax=Winogradskyella echinorum TaxID=538189 RepID=A0ABR6Y1Z9_9FLAO|nr:T9SS type A sorting domain-containing protein [Winogradskyella echinorum]MBC3846777.1 T9SS type A sorting domain-containing protein [Winogradskyella echinorum]MBC5751125.1 T9SS type A sorting domain-containing protein [Winogradskyella echinorum]
MKTILITLLLFCFLQQMYAQENSGYRIISSNLGSSGSSKNVVTSKGTYKVSQSIGQSSVIGTYANNGYYLRQGYQQPLTNVKVTNNLDNDLNLKVYPNPFVNVVVISFSDTMFMDIAIMLFDVNGKIIHNQEFLPLQKVELNLNDLSSGLYFLKVTSGRKYFNEKLIKI